MSTDSERNLRARPTTVSEIRGLLTIPVHSLTGPSYAGLHSPPLTHYVAHAHARRGVVETVPLMGKKKAVPVAPLLRHTGVEDAPEAPDADKSARQAVEAVLVDALLAVRSAEADRRTSGTDR